MSRRAPINDTLPEMLSVCTKDRPLAELNVRYANRRFSPDLYKVTADFVDESESLLPFKCPDNIGTNTEEPADEEKPLIEDSDKGEIPDASVGPLVVVQVLLLKLPVVHTRFLFSKLELLTASKNNRSHFYGGPVTAADGSTASAHKSLVNAAVRYLKGQAQLDLSSLAPSQWTRFATFHAKPAQTTVYLIPRLWEADADNLVARTVYHKEVITHKKNVTTEYEEEEEVEEEVLQEVEGGTVEEAQKVKVMVKKPVKKTKQEVIETQEVLIKTWAIPEYATLEQTKVKDFSWQLKLIASLIIECYWRHAAGLIRVALASAREKSQKVMERKRKREEEAAEKEARKKARTQYRDDVLRLRVNVLEDKWKTDDEGLTQEDIEGAKPGRVKEKEQLKTELQEQWKKEDEEEAATDESKDENMDGADAVKVATIDESLLTACSIFDSGIYASGYGALPSEEMHTGILKALLTCTSRQSRHAIEEIIKGTFAATKFGYRVLTDVLPTE
ncbi:hypothetical protein DIPPA_09473 [Diplonema papillatum]|nr:hypothetical protein DIPPA_09473 [Diplonema papillatum]